MDKKTIIKTVIVVACLALAISITFITSRGRTTGIDSIDPEEKIWVICLDEGCQSQYETNRKEYFAYIQKNASPGYTPPLECDNCGQMTVYRAKKCEKCEAVFMYGAYGNDYPDRCTACGFSKEEDARKKAKANRKKKK